MRTGMTQSGMEPNHEGSGLRYRGQHLGSIPDVKASYLAVLKPEHVPNRFVL